MSNRLSKSKNIFSLKITFYMAITDSMCKTKCLKIKQHKQLLKIVCPQKQIKKVLQNDSFENPCCNFVL